MCFFYNFFDWYSVSIQMKLSSNLETVHLFMSEKTSKLSRGLNNYLPRCVEVSHIICTLRLVHHSGRHTATSFEGKKKLYSQTGWWVVAGSFWQLLGECLGHQQIDEVAYSLYGSLEIFTFKVKAVPQHSCCTRPFTALILSHVRHGGQVKVMRLVVKRVQNLNTGLRHKSLTQSLV